jgi:hypothetical protein
MSHGELRFLPAKLSGATGMLAAHLLIMQSTESRNVLSGNYLI